MFLRFVFCLLAVMSTVTSAGALTSIALKTYHLNESVSIPFMMFACVAQAAVAALCLSFAIAIPRK